MTFALAVVFFAALMIYCGLKGKSLRNALTGKSVLAPSSSLVSG